MKDIFFSAIGACALILGFWASSARAELEFDIWEYRVDGVSLIDIKDVEQELYPLLGLKKTIADVEKAAVALERLYKDKGYPTVFVDIPEQDVLEGVVSLKVTEGRISRLRISEADYFSIKNIEHLVPTVKKGTTPDLGTLQEEIVALNSITPDLSITPVMKPGKTPGTVEIELMVDDTFPMHGEIEFNNDASESTTESRAALNVHYDNLWQKFHSIGLQFQATPEQTDEVQVMALTYLLPANRKKDRLVIYGVLSNTDVVTNVGDLSVLGDGILSGVRYLYSVAATPIKSQSLSFGFDYKSFDESILGGEVSETTVEYAIGNVAFNHSKFSASVLQSFSLGFVFGLPLSSNTTEEFFAKRKSGRVTIDQIRKRGNSGADPVSPNELLCGFNPEEDDSVFCGADPHFMYLEGTARRVDRFGEFFEWHNKLKFQLTDDLLISNEQFSVGGSRSVRGFYESQLLGDFGSSFSTELHIKPHQISKWKGPAGLELDFYLFADIGAVQIIEPDPSVPETSELFSYGLGLTLSHKLGFELKGDFGRADDDVGEIESGDVRGHLRLRYLF